MHGGVACWLMKIEMIDRRARGFEYEGTKFSTRVGSRIRYLFF
eukprot:SAG31_NODE_285_length_18479_cov_9.871980_16_plen_43_part_00